MQLYLRSAVLPDAAHLKITGSKSETNRLLLLQALFPVIRIENGSNSDDSVVMQKALSGKQTLIDVHHAGTAMRFLTAFFASCDGASVEITGSARMKERPIGILVDALRDLGADIEYLEQVGFPPLTIKGKRLAKKRITLQADVSSQYITALLLIAPRLENGLELELSGRITSVPYVNMTLSLLNEIGVAVQWKGNVLCLDAVGRNFTPRKNTLTVESDWSSASYFYSMVALSDSPIRLALDSYKSDSFQGDSALAVLYAQLGVETQFTASGILLLKTNPPGADFVFRADLNNTPDIAQTIAVSCFGLGIGCQLTGLHTLRIKETDRLKALHTELTKLGAEVAVDQDSFILQPSNSIVPDVAIDTYNDHRMAMAFAPLALKSSLIINDAAVVSKSFPGFWDDLKALGFDIEQLQ